MSEQPRLEYLDGIRGLAILLVFFAHLSAGVFPHDIPLILGYSFLQGGGLIGVQLFFALSGYLITRNLQKNLKNMVISASNFFILDVFGDFIQY